MRKPLVYFFLFLFLVNFTYASNKLLHKNWFITDLPSTEMKAKNCGNISLIESAFVYNDYASIKNISACDFAAISYADSHLIAETTPEEFTGGEALNSYFYNAAPDTANHYGKIIESRLNTSGIYNENFSFSMQYYSKFSHANNGNKIWFSLGDDSEYYIGADLYSFGDEEKDTLTIGYSEPAYNGRNVTRFKITHQFGDSVMDGFPHWSNLSINNILIYGNNAESEEYNALPLYNYSFGNTTCLNQNITNSTLNIPLYINAWDYDADEIYYSFYNSAFITNFYSVYYQKEAAYCILGFCSAMPDFDFLNRTYTNDNCNISNEYYIGQDNIKNIVIWDNIQKRYVLRLSDSCIGEKEYDYVFQLPLQNVYYSTSILDLNNGEDFNLSFYNNAYENELTKLQFKKSANLTKIYDYEGNEIASLSLNKDFTFSLIENSNNNSNRININSNDYYYNKSLSNTSTYFVRLSYEGTIYQTGFYYSGSFYQKTFSTSNYYEIPVNYAGLQCIDFYITDSKNLNIKSTYEKICIDVKYCKYDSISVDNSENPISLWKNIIGDALNLYLDRIGGQEKGQGLLYWIWLFLFIGLCISGFMITHDLNITFPLVASSFLCLILSWIANYPINIAAFIILTAMGITAPIVNHYLQSR